jgi:hypothetical protein
VIRSSIDDIKSKLISCCANESRSKMHLFEQLHELDTLSRSLVVSNKVLEVVWVHDNVQTAYVGEADLVCLETSQAHFLPRGHTVCLGGRLHCFSVLLQVDVAEGELRVVVDVDEQDLRSLEHALVVASLACNGNGGIQEEGGLD